MDIIPLDSEFQRAKGMLPTDSLLIYSVVKCVRSRFPDANIEWDEGAGDSWVMVNHNGMNLAMLNATIPLLFVHPAVAEVVGPISDLAVIFVERDYTSRHFSICPDTVLDTLNLIWPAAEVDHTQFSLAELSWATI